MTLPNIMILQYLKMAAKASPELRMRAESFVRQGYQRLLTFEVNKAGFSWFGETPANVMLSAYGLVEFAEMARVISIDDAIIPRTRAWLLAQRRSDGHFEEPRSAHSLDAGSDEFSLTAFVTWAMLQSGATVDDVRPSLGYLRERVGRVEDPYGLALTLNVLAHSPGHEPEAHELARRLLRLGSQNGWKPSGRTLVRSSGDAASVEVTALVVLGLTKLGIEPAALTEAVARLHALKQPDGMWYTTTGTVLALKALLAEKSSPAPFEGTLAVTVDGKPAGEVAVSDKNADIMKILDLKSATHTGPHEVRIEPRLSRQHPFAVQLTSSYYLPWAAVPAAAPPPLVVKQTFDRTTLAVDDHIIAKVELDYTAPASGSMVLLDLGIPPGFAVETGDLEGLVEKSVISRYELTGRQAILYVPPLVRDRTVAFNYRLRARFPMRAQTPPSTAYEYYDPTSRVALPPVALEVK